MLYRCWEFRRPGARMPPRILNLTRFGMLIAATVLALLTATADVVAAQTCSPDQIAAVIDNVAAELRKLNAEHQPAFQVKLRRLAERKKWADADIERKGVE